MNKSTSFLDEVAQTLVKRYTEEQLSNCCVLFPNRRSSFFFWHALAKHLTKPIWAPQMDSLEDFLYARLGYYKPNAMRTLLLLHQVAIQLNPKDTFHDEYLQIGSAIIHDFDDIDKQGVNSQKIFGEVRDIKELEDRFAMDDSEGLKIAQSFWSRFKEGQGRSQRQFLRFWHQLPALYKNFRQELRQRNWATPGMLYREATQKASLHKLLQSNEHFIFVGFHILSRTEQRLIEACLRAQRGDVFWDVDAYYMEDSLHSAGHFLRQYARKPPLSNSFHARYPSHFGGQNISICTASSATSQIKAASLYLQTYLQKCPEARILFVLPQEERLYPLLHALPESMGKQLNITMGYRLSHTPFASLFQLLARISSRRLIHRDLLSSWWQHPFVSAAGGKEALKNSQELDKDVKIAIPIEDICKQDPLIADFVRAKATFFTRTQSLVQMLYDDMKKNGTIGRMEKHFFETLLNYLVELTETEAAKHLQVKSEGMRKKLFKQLLGQLVVPFVGEPIRPIQVMGWLETRNLDFDLVILLDMNEGIFPKRSTTSSLIPYALRRAYQLPTHLEDNVNSSYLFYRLLQRTKEARIYTLVSTDDALQKGEASRFVQQLRYECPPSIQRQEESIAPPFALPESIQPKPIDKSEGVYDGLKSHTSYPLSNWIDYLECPLRFYYKMVLKLKLPDKPMHYQQVFGSVFHKCVEKLYQSLCSSLAEPRQLRESDLKTKEKEVVHIVSQQLGTHSLDAAKGEPLLMKRALINNLHALLRTDLRRLPFAVIALEEDIEYKLSVPNHSPIVLKGRIDRLDLKGDKIALMDYKTGFLNTQRLFFSAEELAMAGKVLASREARQVGLYAFMYGQKGALGRALKPLLWIGRHSAHSSSMAPIRDSKGVIEDLRPQFEDMQRALQDAANDLFNPNIPFSPTEHLPICHYCDYRSLCYGEKEIQF